MSDLNDLLDHNIFEETIVLLAGDVINGFRRWHDEGGNPERFMRLGVLVVSALSLRVLRLCTDKLNQDEALAIKRHFVAEVARFLDERFGE